MMRGTREQRVAFSPMKEAAAVPKEEVWEVRPGGMLVQKRSPDADPPPGGAPVPTIRVKVKFNGVYHEIYINAQASFGTYCLDAANADSDFFLSLLDYCSASAIDNKIVSFLIGCVDEQAS